MMRVQVKKWQIETSVFFLNSHNLLIFFSVYRNLFMENKKNVGWFVLGKYSTR